MTMRHKFAGTGITREKLPEPKLKILVECIMILNESSCELHELKRNSEEMSDKVTLVG